MAPSREIEKLQRRWQENPLGLTFAPLAEAYRKEGMYEDALELLSIGLAQHPNYVPAHIVRGRCYVDTHTDTAAEEAFQRVTELDPENVIALKGLADLAEKGGRFDEAIARLDRLLEFDRSNDDARAQADRLRAALAPVVETPVAPPEPAPAPVEAELPEPTIPEFPRVEADAVPDPEPATEEADSPVDQARAAVVDVSAADVEVITYRPLELVASADSEYQLADAAADLVPPPGDLAGAPGLADPVTEQVDAVAEQAERAADQIGLAGEQVGVAAEQIDQSVGPVDPVVDQVDHDVERVDSPAEQVAFAGEREDATAEQARFAGELESATTELAGLAADQGDRTDPVADQADVPVAETVSEVSEPALPATAAPESPVEGDSVATDAPIDAATQAEPANDSDFAAVEEVVLESPAVASLSAAPVDIETDASVAPEPVLQDEAAHIEADELDEAAFDVDALDPERDDAEAVAGVEAEPDLVVTETMAELFMRQGHRTLALAVYTQLSERDGDNPRIRGAIEQLQAELRPASSVGIPAYAAVLTGGQSVRAFFEHLLAATRPIAPDRQATGLSLGAVFGEERATPAASAPAEDRGPSYDEFFAEEQPPAELPKRPDREGAAVDAAAEDLEHFTSWLKGLKR